MAKQEGEHVERDKALDMAVSQIHRQFGKGAIMKMGDAADHKIEIISTGALALDLALGVGGVPRGRVVELYGTESSGKTTLALHIVAEAQRNGGIAAFIDAEHALDPGYAKAIGVDIDELLISQPDTGEQALEIADMLIRSGALDVVVIDSVAALVPKAELDGEMGDAHVGLQARLMSQALRKLTGSLNRSRTTAVFINQLREKIGILFGSPEVTPGGRALKFYSSVRLEVRRIETIKDGAESVGNRVRVKVTKNKCVAAGTQIFDPTTGLTHRIEEIVEENIGTAVIAADKAGNLQTRPIVARLAQGEQEVIGLKFRSGTKIQVTPDHKVLTDQGWVMAGELRAGDQVARPRRIGTFGQDQPIPPDHARLLGYLVGDGYVGGKTPIHFFNTAEELHDDVTGIVSALGCRVARRGISLHVSHRLGEKNGVLELVRWAGIHGHLAWEKRLPSAFFADGIDSRIVAEVLFGLWETDGWISREQTGGVRVGFVTTSEQLAHQIHWLLLRFGIGSNSRVHKPGSRRSIINGREIRGKRPCWQVRISGIDNVQRFAEVVPMWGPRGRILTEELSRPEMKAHRGSQMIYLPPSATEPVLAYLDGLGVTAREVGGWLGAGEDAIRSGFKALLGMGRLRRDRLAIVAEALDSEFLRQVLDEDIWYDRVWEITTAELAQTYDIEVEELHNFVANDLVMHNCAPPFRQAEFDIVFGEGISREGSLLDVAVEHGVVKKSGAWFTFDNDQLGQGRENAKRFLRENPEVAMQLQAKVYELVGMGSPGESLASAEVEEVEPAGD
jgi:recombination protein RecA